MSRDRRPAAVERISDFAGRVPVPPQQPQDSASGRVRERAERAIDRHDSKELADLLINVKKDQ